MSVLACGLFLYDLRSKTNSVRLSPAITPCPPLSASPSSPPSAVASSRWLVSRSRPPARLPSLPDQSFSETRCFRSLPLIPQSPPPSLRLEILNGAPCSGEGGSDPVGQSVSVFLSDHFRFGHSSTSNPPFSPPSFTPPSLAIFEGRFASNDGMGATQCSQSVISLRFRVGTARIDSIAKRKVPRPEGHYFSVRCCGILFDVGRMDANGCTLAVLAHPPKENLQSCEKFAIKQLDKIGDKKRVVRF